jgi:hypothetical protein
MKTHTIEISAEQLQLIRNILLDAVTKHYVVTSDEEEAAMEEVELIIDMIDNIDEEDEPGMVHCFCY